MTELNQDQRELITNGGILGFVNPISSLNAIETCEGNVQLSYFDDEGKMRQTNFDATADSRNASFEQWIPDKLPLCFQFSDNNSVNCGDNIELASSSFTVEFWAKRDEIANENQFIISQGEAQKNKGLHIGFRSNGKFTFAFHTNDLDTEETYIDDLDWHYWCCVYDSENQTRRIYRDGEVTIHQTDVNEEYQGSGNFILGRYLKNSNYFTGKLAEVSI
ncbi:MAG: LamG domain-containing protein, partial [Rivularia sp. ALOHA_DT_140]|nr:LamG domain-containing protein [Rivularia sp. ALOHA_DT_140]